MWQIFALLALSAVTANASFSNNLNYRSPSHNHHKHPNLGVSVDKVSKRSDPHSAFDPEKLEFTHGVASGDPLPHSVILWTRCSPTYDDVKDNSSTSGFVPLYNPVPIYKDTDENKPVSNAPVCLNFHVSEHENLDNPASEGTVYTSSDVDYTVKVCQN